MDVTVTNFDDLLPEVEAAIDQCSFIAIDCELSGLKVTDEKDNYFEAVDERYHSLRNSASEFLVLQFGLVPFFYDPVKDVFTHKAYNFYTFPRQSGRGGPNIRFLCESSSIEFLCSTGFDFNKLFYEGIPHLTYSGEKKMRDDLDKWQTYLASEENSTPIPVPEYMKKFVKETEETIKRFVASNKTEYVFENLNPFHRKLIFNNIKPKYGNKLYFESVNLGDSECSSASESDKSDSEGTSSGPTKVTSGSGSSKKSSTSKVAGQENVKSASGEKKPDERKNTSRHRDKVLKVTKVSEEELNRINEEKKLQKLENIEKALGFSKVIRKISESGKVIVGHNMLLDVSHTVSQFVDELPDNLADFKNIVQSTFPNIVDTKLMASTHPFRELVSSTVLIDLLKRLQVEPFFLPEIQKVHDEGAIGYAIRDEKMHEAGYDAFITGVCFIGMCQYLGTLQSPKKPRVLPESPLVMPFLNKIYLMRLLDITYLNISGTDLTPSRSHVFHVSCPKDAVQKDIQDMFNPFGSVQFHWQNDTSLFIALNDKDQAPLVMRTIDLKPGYRVVPFTHYQTVMREKKRPLTGDSPERPQEGSVIKPLASVGDSKSPSSNNGQKKKRPKTETKEVKKAKPPTIEFEEPSSWD